MLHGIFFLKPTRNAEVRLAKLWTHSDLGRKARWSHFLQGLVRYRKSEAWLRPWLPQCDRWQGIFQQHACVLSEEHFGMRSGLQVGRCPHLRRMCSS